MDTLSLSRLQFGLTIGFHYLFPPLSIGLGLLLVIMEGLFLRTGQEIYRQATRFWARIFGLIFALGVATGLVMEFEFGTNWAPYSRFVGDVFGSALAAEGIFAFFLESGFLALVLFGWERVRPTTHFVATCLVALGAHFSAVWIVVANSWQQTPAGHHIVAHGLESRAETLSFWGVVFNPSTLQRLGHTLSGCWLAGSFLVISVGAYYVLRQRFVAVGQLSVKLGLRVACLAALVQLATGHASAQGIAEHQPAKLAAFEGHYPARAVADMYLAGWVDEERERVTGLALPGFLSWLVHFDFSKPVTGLNAFAAADRPPVNAVFQSYHLMVAIGMALIGLALLASLYLWRGRLFTCRWLLWLLVGSVLLPQLANQLGWVSAEVGRQPWLVYGLLRTTEGYSAQVPASQVALSIAMFCLLYLLLGALFVFLLDHKIKAGPDEVGVAGAGRA